MTAHPDVTVVVSCYNHAAYLTQCLDSVAEQTYLPSQLIITDDASTDDSAELIEAWIETRWPSAEFVHNRVNLGLPRTLNSVRPRVRGDLVVTMSSDDRMTRHRIERQVKAFGMADPNTGMIYSDMEEFDEAGIATGQRWFDTDRMGPAASGDLYNRMIRRAFISAPTVMVRRDVYDAVGDYDESLVAEDYDFFLRLSRQAEWVYIDEPLVSYRVLSSSLSRSPRFQASYRVGRIAMLRKHMGVSAQTDEVIVQRTAQMVESLYKEGRSPQETAADMRFVLRHQRSLRSFVILSLSTARVSGAGALALGRYLRRVRGYLRSAVDRIGDVRSSLARVWT